MIQTFFSERYSFVFEVYSVFEDKLCFICLRTGSEENLKWGGGRFCDNGQEYGR
jgi:hypothetical protein